MLCSPMAYLSHRTSVGDTFYVSPHMFILFTHKDILVRVCVYLFQSMKRNISHKICLVFAPGASLGAVHWVLHQIVFARCRKGIHDNELLHVYHLDRYAIRDKIDWPELLYGINSIMVFYVCHLCVGRTGSFLEAIVFVIKQLFLPM